MECELLRVQGTRSFRGPWHSKSQTEEHEKQSTLGLSRFVQSAILYIQRTGSNLYTEAKSNNTNYQLFAIMSCSKQLDPGLVSINIFGLTWADAEKRESS